MFYTQFFEIDRQAHVSEKNASIVICRQVPFLPNPHSRELRKTRFANRAIFFGLCSAMNVIHAGTITASPAPCVTLYTALISCSRNVMPSLLTTYSASTVMGNCPTPHDIGACFVIVRVLLHFICFFDDSHQVPSHSRSLISTSGVLVK